MADSLLDMYLGTSSAKKADEEPKSLTDTYLGSSSGSAANVDSKLVPAGAPFNGVTEYKTPEAIQAGVEATKKLPASRFREVGQLPLDMANAASEMPGDIGSAIYKDAAASGAQFGKGMDQLTTGEPASAVGNMGMGALSFAVSPLSGATKEVIKKPVTKLTGSPEIGEKTEMVASFGLPVKGGAAKISNEIPSNKAMNILVDAIGPENIASTVAELKSNPRLAVYDVSPSVQQMAQKLILTEGEHQNKFASHVAERAGTAKSAMTETLDSTLGVPVDALAKINEMKANAAKTGKDLIEPHVAKAGTADITGVIDNIDKLIANGGMVERKTLEALKAGKEPPLPLSDAQSKLFDIREKLRGNWQDRENMFLDVAGEQGLHARQKELRAEAQSLLDSSVGSERTLGKKLMDVRNQMVDAIDAKAPGYKDALGKYRDDMQVQEAFDKGFNVLNPNPKRIESRPEFFKDEFKKASDAEKEAMREGTRIAFDSVLRGYKSAPTNPARKGADIVQNEFNVENLKTMFGEKEATKMSKALTDEWKIADSNMKLLGNSQTAMRTKNNSHVDLPVEKPAGVGNLLAPLAEVASISAGGMPGLASAAIIGGNLAKKGAYKFGELPLAKAKNNQLTDLMTAQGETRQALIDALEKRIPQGKQSLLARVRNTALPVLPP